MFDGAQGLPREGQEIGWKVGRLCCHCTGEGRAFCSDADQDGGHSQKRGGGEVFAKSSDPTHLRALAGSVLPARSLHLP